MNESVVQYSSTVLTLLTFSAPDALMTISYLTAMYDLWHICRHIFILTTPTIKEAADNGKGCGALPDKCLSDLKDSLMGSWGTASNDIMCSKLVYDPIPSSCRDSFRFTRQDMLGMLRLPRRFLTQ